MIDNAPVSHKENKGDAWGYPMLLASTVKPLLGDHWYERPTVLKDHRFLAESPTFQCKLSCHQTPPVVRDHIFMTNGAVFQDRFYCTCV